MKYKGTLIVVKDCNRALKFYSDMFGFQLLQDNEYIFTGIGILGTIHKTRCNSKQ